MSSDSQSTVEIPRGRRKERRGVVVSDAMDKTVVVRVDVIKPHPKYKKMMRRSIRLTRGGNGRRGTVMVYRGHNDTGRNRAPAA